jgi:hypothetical protein
MNDFEVKELHEQVQDMNRRLEGIESLMADLLEIFIDELLEE